MNLLTIDFETYYSKEYSLSKKDITTQSYIDDERFETIGVAVKVNDGETEWFSGTHAEISGWLNQFDWENSIAIAHNALFDASILAWHFCLKPKMWADTLSMARAIHGTEVGGSLKALAEHYGIGVKGEEVLNALGKRRLHFLPEELARYGEYCRNDVELTYALFTKLAPRFNKTEIKLIDMTIKMHSEPSFQLDIEVLEDHLHTIRAKKAMLLMQCDATGKELMSNPKFAALLEERGVAPPVKISPTTGKLTYAFAKTDEGMKALLDHPDIEVQALTAARIGVKSTLEETRTQRFIDMAHAGGALPVPLKYYGAMTGRWSATDGTNLQNLPRGSRLKEAIVAPEGYKIVGADLSNIELRMGLYFAGQMDKVALLAGGRDLYRDFIAPIFGVAYEDVNEEQRFIGKTSQLSLIYGTGKAKLRAAIKQLSGKDIGEDLAAALVSRYRSEYRHVAASWSLGEEALRAIHLNTKDTFGSHPDLKLDVWGAEGIELPSGLLMTYPGLHQVERVVTNEYGSMTRLEWRYFQRKKMEKIHGPKCFQNTIQALARCIMGESMVRIHKRFPVALTIHDAVYCVVPEDMTDEAKRFIVQELRREPSWAPGLPLDAECGEGDNLSFKMKKLE